MTTDCKRFHYKIYGTLFRLTFFKNNGELTVHYLEPSTPFSVSGTAAEDCGYCDVSDSDRVDYIYAITARQVKEIIRRFDSVNDFKILDKKRNSDLMWQPFIIKSIPVATY